MNKVLVIDDERGIRDTIADFLTHYNYRVHTAKNGNDGILITIKEKPDLIICDVNMPDLDGFKTLQMLRKNNLIHNTCFIFLTAKVEKEDRRRGMELAFRQQPCWLSSTKLILPSIL